jgi:hypothetical protein
MGVLMLRQFKNICYIKRHGILFGLISSLSLVANSIDYGGQER